MAYLAGMVGGIMEIWTLLKANIRYKKGSFASIAILMTIISMALVAILSAWDNIYGGIEDAQERMDTASMMCLIEKNKLSEQLLSDIEKHSLVKKVKVVEAIGTSKVTYKDSEYSNEVFAQEVRDGARLLNEDGTGFLEEVPELKTGEIYISRGMETNFSCEVGDTLTFTFTSGSYDFRIQGIMEDPELGASTIGWKNAFISHEDYKTIYEQADKLAEEEGYCIIVDWLSIYKNEDCNLNDARFARQINLDTGISDMSFSIITKANIINYSTLFPKIICMILTVFVILLLAAVLVIMCHSISTGIEMEYVSLGILKSQGFRKIKIQVILAAQYLLAQILGVLIGTLAAVPLCKTIGNLFHPITGIVPRKAISFGKCGCILLAVFAVSILCIALITEKVDKISPVRAISGGKKEIYFDSRIRAAIRKKLLSLSLAFRQFTSNKRQYAGVLSIVVILVYFMTTMMVLANVITATSAWEAMGIDYSDLDIELHKELSDSEIQDIEEIIRKSSSFQVSYKYCGNYYFSINGEQIMACICSDSEYITAISKGREPLYDNEIVMTQIAADNLNLKVGDKVSVGWRDKKADYIICGLNQHMYDAGVNFSMTMDAASRLEPSHISYLGYILEDRLQGETIVKALNEQYGEDVLSVVFDENPMDETYQLAIYAMTLVVYIFSVIFALVAVHMVCSKAFLRERRDIGIYKALGFTSGKLRLQFAARFFIVALLGAAIGSGLAAVFAGKMLSSILRLIGISSFQVSFQIQTFAVPVAVICFCFFFFAFAASRRIKKVEVRELVVE